MKKVIPAAVILISAVFIVGLVFSLIEPSDTYAQSASDSIDVTQSVTTGITISSPSLPPRKWATKSSFTPKQRKPFCSARGLIR